MQFTVILSYYKSPDNLLLILQALNRQSNRDFEVIISEDDNNPDTVALLQKIRGDYRFPILHLHQNEDLGFRKNSMLNKCLRHAQADSLVFIDGDCIPHQHFLNEYAKHLVDGCFLSGRAVMLGEKISADILATKSLKKLNFWSLLFSDSKKVKEGIYSPYLSLSLLGGGKGRGLVGRNWGVRKKHLIEINGFDEDYITPGVGEDVDIEWRLLQNGIIRKSVKNKAIVYHIYHPRNYASEKVLDNYKILDKKKENNTIVCFNGLQTISPKK